MSATTEPASPSGVPAEMTIPVSRGYLGRIALGCLIAVAGLVWLVVREAIVSWLLAVSVASFLAVLIVLPFLVARSRIRLRPDGLALRSPLGETSMAWPEAEIALVPALRHLRITAARCQRRRGWWSRGAPAANRVIWLKGDWFGMSSEELARRITEYRDRATARPLEKHPDP